MEIKRVAADESMHVNVLSMFLFADGMRTAIYFTSTEKKGVC